jgi:allophanate hydrolase
MVLGPALADDVVLDVAGRLTGGSPLPAACPADAATAEVVVVGHHLSGQPRNGELTGRGGVLLQATTTGPEYRLLCIGGPDAVPALRHRPGDGAAIEVELWQLPAAALAGFLAGLPDVLALGRVQLADGRNVPGLVVDAAALADRPVTDITAAGGWRAHLARELAPL